MKLTDNLVQQVEQFALKHKDDQAVRLRKGKLVAGDFKGTRWQRMGKWLMQMQVIKFLTKKTVANMEERIHGINQQEKLAFSQAFTKAISARMIQPFSLQQVLAIDDVKAILKDTRNEREWYSNTVDSITNAILEKSPFVTNPLDGAKRALNTEVEQQRLWREDQMHQLRHDVSQTLKKARVKKDKIQNIDAAILDQTLKIQLLNEACEYADRTFSNHQQEEDTDNLPLMNNADDEWNQRRSLSNKQRRVALKHVSPADIAVQQLKDTVDDLINDNELPSKKELDKKIKKLKNINEPWAKEVIILLNQNTDKTNKQAILMERIHQASSQQRRLQKQKSKAQEQLKSIWPLRRWMAKRTIKQVERRLVDNEALSFPANNEQPVVTSNSNYPQRYRDMAADTIDWPARYDAVPVSKEDAIEQTITMLKAKYASLANKGSVFVENEIRAKLESYLGNRSDEQPRQ